MSNSVLIACSLVVSEEGGHGEAVIRSERRLRGHAEKPFVLPATIYPGSIHQLNKRTGFPGRDVMEMYFGLLLGLYEEGGDVIQDLPRKELPQL